MKVKSSIDAPFNDIEPIIFSFSNWILSLCFNASSREIVICVSFCSRLGASPLCSIFSFSTMFWSTVDFSGTKNYAHKTITADDKAIAAIVFLESIIF